MKNARHHGKILKGILIALAIVVIPSQSLGKKNDPQMEEELAKITTRGRMLADYHLAVMHASEAVRALHPPKGSIGGIVAKHTDHGWVVGFGALNQKRDRFLVVYEATQKEGTDDYAVTADDPPKEDAGYYCLAYKALQTGEHAFQGERRPYEADVIPTDSNQFYVYIYPGQTTEGIYPYGGDARYLISSDGATIVESRRMHNAILESRPLQVPRGAKFMGGNHSHVVSDLPEDTDVLLVLTRKPAGPEFIGAKSHVFVVNPDGSIRVEK